MNALSTLPVDRRAERTNLLLAATLWFGRASAPVRVRNLSAMGALVEGPSLPTVGSAITLRRGELEAFGKIVWAKSGKAGLTFSGFVDVSAWLPTKNVKRQVRIDPISVEVQQVRTAEATTHPAVESANSMVAVVAELVMLQGQLGQLGAQLALDSALLAKYPEVQLLDVAGLRIARIVAALQRGGA